MDEDTKDVLKGLAGLVVVGYAGLCVLSSIKQEEREEKKAREEERRQEEMNNTIYNCSSCKEDYRFGDSGSTKFCSEECERRGALVVCGDPYCHNKYFANEGHVTYGVSYCSNSCAMNDN